MTSIKIRGGLFALAVVKRHGATNAHMASNNNGCFCVKTRAVSETFRRFNAQSYVILIVPGFNCPNAHRPPTACASIRFIFHFLAFAFFSRAMTPSAVTASGSSPCSHFQTARGETPKMSAPSACVTFSRSSSDLSCSENVIINLLLSANRKCFATTSHNIRLN